MIAGALYAGARIPHLVAEDSSLWSSTVSSGSVWTLSNGDRTATVVSGTGVREVRGTLGRSSRKRYFEIVKTLSGNLGVLIRDEYGFSQFPFAGGVAADGAAYRRGGAIFQSGTNILFVTPLDNGDVVNVAIDLDTGNYWFGRNGAWVQGDPGTGASPLGAVTTGIPYYPGAASETPLPCDVTLNTLFDEFLYSVPSGFTSWAAV